MSKLDSTEKHDSNFGNLCMKKAGSFQKERFFILFFNRQWGGGVTPEPPRVYATDTRGITPMRVTSGGAHLRNLAPGLHNSEKTSQPWRAVGALCRLDRSRI